MSVKEIGRRLIGGVWQTDVADEGGGAGPSAPVFVQTADPLVADPSLADGAIWVDLSQALPVISVLIQGQWGSIYVGDTTGGTYAAVTIGGITFVSGGATKFGVDASVFQLGYASNPNDLFIASSHFALWLDDTPGATKLMVKAKDSGGTVRTASINLS